MRVVGTHRPRHGAPYQIYVSESGRELRRRRQRRNRRLVVVSLLVVIAAAVFVAGGWAQDVWSKLVGPADANGPVAGSTASPAASGVLIKTVTTVAPVDPPPPIVSEGDGVKVGTYLGDETRRLYGLGPPPTKLSLIWKTFIGGGMTSPVGKGPNEPWSGSGWTGQPVIVRDKGKLFLLWGAFDRKLHKIDLKTGKVVWEYDYDDIIKSSPTVIEDPSPKVKADKYLVLAGSRRGWPSGFTDSNLAPYRAVSFGSGKELWRLPVPLTASYSRDVDGSGFFYKNRMYSGVESGWFYKLDPFATEPWNGYRKPKIIAERLLLGDSSAASHGGNLVLEASPALLDDVVYVASGAGHVYGMRRSDLKVVWDYKTGSDMDGTTVATANGKLIVAVEKQYISGHGGILMLDPSKDPSELSGLVLPHRRPHPGRLGGRRDRVGGRQRHLRPVGPPPAARRLHGHRRQPLRRLPEQDVRQRARPQRRRALPHPAPHRRVPHRRQHQHAHHGGRHHRRGRLRQRHPPLQDQVQDRGEG